MRVAVDIAALLVGCLIASVAAWRWGLWGWVAGFIAFSGLIILRTQAQYWFDPNRDAGVLDAAAVSSSAHWRRGVGNWMVFQ
jgi:hypothetical protein